MYRHSTWDHHNAKKINVPTLHNKSCPMKGSVVCIKRLLYQITPKSLINFIV